MANGTPATIPPGMAVKLTRAAAPTVIPKAALVPAATPDPVALSVYPAPARSMRQPAKVAMPATAVATGVGVQDRVAPVAPVPVVMARVTASAEPVTRLPPASRTSTTGPTPNAVPPVPPAGLVVNTSCAAGPTAMPTAAVLAPASPGAVATRTYPVPARSILQPEKVARPATAALACPPAQVSAAPGVPVPGASARVTVALLAARLPYASRTRTTGCVLQATPPVPPEGATPTASEAAAPAVTAKPVEVAAARPAAVATRVYPVPERSRLQPAKTAVPPEAAATWPPVQASVPPPGLVPTESVTSSAAPATVLPPASATATTGWAPKAAPAVPPPGWVANRSLAAGPVVTANGVEVAAARPGPVALSWYPVPALSIVQPAKVAVPATAARPGPPVHASAAPAVPVPVASARVTVVVAVVGLPPASSSRTTGWVAHAVPPVPPPGLVSKRATAAGPVVTGKAFVTTVVRAPDVAVRVYPAPTLSTLQPANSAVPLEAAFASPPLHASAAPNVPVPGVRASVTVAVEVVRLPNWSTIRNEGWVAQATPPVPPEGCAVTARAAPEAATIENAAEVAPARPGETAASW